MKTYTQILAAAAIASFFPSAVTEARYDMPWLFIIAITAGALPDIISRLIRINAKANVTVAPDPVSSPVPMIAQGITAAIAIAREKNQPARLRIKTFARAISGSGAFYISDATSEVVAPDSGERAQIPRLRPALNEPYALDAPDDITLEIVPQNDASGAPLCLPYSPRWPHGLPFAMLAAIIALPLGITAATLAFSTLFAHIFLDGLGREHAEWLAPFHKNAPQRFGLGLINDHAFSANSKISMVCTGVIVVNLIRLTPYLMWW